MHLNYRNVNDAFYGLVNIFAAYKTRDQHYLVNPCTLRGPSCIEVPLRKTTSRNGAVVMVDEPVTVTYSAPAERVLFNPARDANPFLHVMDALWCLAGRNDVAPLANIVKRMSDFSDDGKTLNGAYGHRWRTAAAMNYNEQGAVDQLDIIVNHLKAFPDSRRAVLQMWNVEDDLLNIGGIDAALKSGSKDVCCNLSVMFSLRKEPYNAPIGEEDNGCTYLDITVTNRSNDLVWGMLGANYVQFSFLQEYVATRLRAVPGKYNHVTNNLHAYVERFDWKPEEWLAAQKGVTVGDFLHMGGGVPIVRNPLVFDTEVDQFVSLNSVGLPPTAHYQEPFLATVAQPMMSALWLHKQGDTQGAIGWLQSPDYGCKDESWRKAAVEWLQRRMKK